MNEVEVTLKRVYEKGRISFELPSDPVEKQALIDLFWRCHTKDDDMVHCVLRRPYRIRSTGIRSQNHHLNGHIQQIAVETGNDFDTVKQAVKERAIDMGYPCDIICGKKYGKPEHLSDTAECAILIEAVHLLASELEIILKEES